MFDDDDDDECACVLKSSPGTMDAHLSFGKVFQFSNEEEEEKKNIRAKKNNSRKRGNDTRRRPRETRNASFAPELRALRMHQHSLSLF